MGELPYIVREWNVASDQDTRLLRAFPQTFLNATMNEEFFGEKRGGFSESVRTFDAFRKAPSSSSALLPYLLTSPFFHSQNPSILHNPLFPRRHSNPHPFRRLSLALMERTQPLHVRRRRASLPRREICRPQPTDQSRCNRGHALRYAARECSGCDARSDPCRGATTQRAGKIRRLQCAPAGRDEEGG